MCLLKGAFFSRVKLSLIKMTGFLRLNADCQISVTVVWNGNENCLPFTTAFVEFLMPLVDKGPLNGTWGFHLTSSVNAFVTKLMRFFRSFFSFFFFFFSFFLCNLQGSLCWSLVSFLCFSVPSHQTNYGWR